jgi:hypothetical protein
MNKMREDFESWANSKGWSLYQDGAGYYHHEVHSLWLAWQASRSSQKVELPATCCRALIIERGLFVQDAIFHDEYFEVDDIKQMLTDAGISYD